MKVRDLVEFHENVPQGATVYLADDAEGNGFSAAEELDIAYIDTAEIVHGQADSLLYAEDLEVLGDDMATDELDEVVVLWPI